MERSHKIKKRRSMLGKRKTNINLVPASIPEPNPKLLSTEKTRVKINPFSGSVVKSQLGRRNLPESSEKSSTVKKNPLFSQQSTKYTVLTREEKSGAHYIKSPTHFKKCLFSKQSKENYDPIYSKWNCETPLADITGITHLPLYSTVESKNTLGQRDKQLKEKLQEHNSEKMENGSTTTPFLRTILGQKFYKDFDSRTPRSIDLKSSTHLHPPPTLYETYLQQRQDKFSSIDYHKNYLLSVNTSKSPKNSDTNSARNKWLYKSCENINTINKSPKVANKRLNFTSCEDISFIGSSPYDEATLESSASWESFSSLPKEIDIKTNFNENIVNKSLENISVIESIDNKVEVSGDRNSSSKDDHGSSRDINKSYLQSSTFNLPVNSTAIYDEGDSDNSFQLNELMTTLTADIRPGYTNKKKLSVVKEESCDNAEHLTKENEFDVTLTNNQFDKTSILISYRENNCADNLTRLQSGIEKLAQENNFLLSNFQKEVLNEYASTLKDKLSDVIKQQIVHQNKIIKNELESVLKNKLWIFKNNFGQQYMECRTLLDSLNTEINCSTSINYVNKHEQESNLKSKIDDMMKENEKLIEKLQMEIMISFQEELSKTLNKRVCEQVDTISTSAKNSMDEIIEAKWKFVNQKIEHKKQQCLIDLETIIKMLNRNKHINDDEGSHDFKKSIAKLQVDLNSFSCDSDEIISDYKKLVENEFKSKIEITSKHIMHKQVDEIIKFFENDFLSKLNSFGTELNSQERKWAILKHDILLNLGTIEIPIEKYSQQAFDETINLPSCQKTESSKKMFSELRSEYKCYLKTPKTSRGRRSINLSNVWTPGSMSTVVNDQLTDLFDDSGSKE